MSLVAAPSREWQMDLCELEVSLVHRVNSRTARTTQKDYFKKPKKEKKKKEKKRQRIQMFTFLVLLSKNKSYK